MKMAHVATINRMFERIPAGQALRSVAQKRFGKRRPATRIPAYKWHRKAAIKYGSFALDQATAYEFGAGKDLACSIFLWCYGVPRQIVVDRDPLLDTRLIAQAMKAIAELDEPSFRRRPDEE